MDKKVLLLNSTYEILSFISDRKAIKLFVKGKVDVVSTWPGIEINFGKEKMGFPATLKLKYFVNKKYSQLAFSRRSLIKRDKGHCQYCGHHLKYDRITVDHIIPKSLGGISSFLNCVVCCHTCNHKKGNRTLEQSNMTLINQPFVPNGFMYYMSDNDHWHDDWKLFFN